eukprot:4860132-Prymnesium_polylepis.1
MSVSRKRARRYATRPPSTNCLSPSTRALKTGTRSTARGGSRCIDPAATPARAERRRASRRCRRASLAGSAGSAQSGIVASRKANTGAGDPAARGAGGGVRMITVCDATRVPDDCEDRVHEVFVTR